MLLFAYVYGMIELVKKNYFFKIQMMKMWRLARAEGSEENHEYFKFLQNEKEGSLRCPASLFHSHTPQLVPVKRYYTHLTEPAIVEVQVFLMQQNV